MEHSEQILALLRKSPFDQGLRKGVPNEVPIAHKFGERFYKEEKQLHDCGIVYYPENPYILCIMTKGDNFDELSNIIGEISKKVYEEVDSRKL